MEHQEETWLKNGVDEHERMWWFMDANTSVKERYAESGGERKKYNGKTMT